MFFAHNIAEARFDASLMSASTDTAWAITRVVTVTTPVLYRHWRVVHAYSFGSVISRRSLERMFSLTSRALVRSFLVKMKLLQAVNA